MKYNGVSIQIDAGPDFRTQMLREGLSDIDAVLFTHEHQDHIAGLDDVRPIIFRTGKAMAIYGQPRVIDRIKKAFHYAFEPQPYPGAPRLDAYELDETDFHISGVEISPIPIIHGQLPIFGYRIGKLAYLTDTNDIPERSMELLENLDVLIIDALHHKTHYSHYTLEEAIAVAKQIGAKKTYFIHMSHYMGTHEDVSAVLPESMYLSYDGLKIDFD